MANQITALLRLLGDSAGAVKAIGEVDKNLSGLQKTAKKVQAVGDTLSKTVTPAIVGMAGAATAASVKFESGFAGVMKTVDGLGESTQELTALGAELRQGFRDLSTTIPIAQDRLLAVGEAAGQLGIETQNIIGFTETMAKLGVTTNLSAEQAAMSLSKFANITGMAQDEFSQLGSAVVDLGNNMATTEADIVEMSQRLAGAGTTVGMTEADILALAASMSSLGIKAQAGGTAMSRVMVDIANAVADGGDKLAGFAEVAGMTSEQFAQMFGDEPVRAIEAFVEGLGEIDDAGGNVFETLEELELGEVRVRDALLRLASAEGVMTDALDISNTAWQENTALQDEAQQRFETTASKLKLLRNRAIDIGVTFGDVILPHLIDFADKLLELGERIGSMDERTQMWVLRLAALAAGLGPVLSITARMVTVLSTLGSVIGPIVSGMGGMASASTGGAAALNAMGGGAAAAAGGLSAVAPALLAVAAAAGVAAASIHIVNRRMAETAERRRIAQQVQRGEIEGYENLTAAGRAHAGALARVIEKQREAAEASREYTNIGLQNIPEHIRLEQQRREEIEKTALEQGRAADSARLAALARAQGAQGAAQAAYEEAQAQEALNEQLSLVRRAIDGPIRKANEQYAKQEEEILDKLSELRDELEEYESAQGTVVGSTEDLVIAQADLQKKSEKLAEAQQALAENTDPERQLELEAAVAKAKKAVDGANRSVSAAGPHHVDYRDQIEQTKGKIDEWMGKLKEAAAAHERHIQEIILQMLEAKLAQSEWSEEAVELYSEYAEAAGLMDEKTAEAWRSVGRVVNDVHATTEEKVSALTDITEGFVRDALGPEAEALLYASDQVKAYTGDLERADGATRLARDSAGLLKDTTDDLSGSAEAASGKIDGLTGEVYGARDAFADASGYANDLRSAIQNIPSSKTITVTLRTPGGLPKEWTLDSPRFKFQTALENLVSFARDNAVAIQMDLPLDELQEFLEIVGGTTDVEQVERAESFWQAIEQFTDTIQSAVEALASMAGYVSPDLQTIRDVGDDILAMAREISGRLKAARDSMETEAVEHAEAFWDQTEAFVDMVGEAVDALASLSTYVSPRRSTITAVGEDILALGEEIAGRLKAAREAMTTSAVEHAQAFWDSVSAFAEMIIGSIEALSALKEYTSPGRDVIISVGEDILALGEEISGRLREARVAMTDEAVEHAQAFWEQTEAFVEMIRAAVETLTALGDYTSPSRSAIAAVGQDILAMGQEISGALREARESMTPAEIERAEAFWSSFGAFADMVADAVDALTGLADYVGPSLPEIESFAQDLADTIKLILRELLIPARTGISIDISAWTEELSSQLSAFSSGVRDAMGAFGDTLDFLLQLGTTSAEDLQGGIDMLEANIDVLKAQMRNVINKMVALAEEILTDWEDGASQIADTASAAAEMVSDAFGALDSVIGALSGLVDMMRDVALVAGTEYLEEADWAGLAWVITRVFQVTRTALEKIRGAVVGLDADAILDAASLIGHVGEAVGALSEAFAAITVGIPPTEGAIEGFLASLVDAYERLKSYIHNFEERLETPWDEISWYSYGQDLIQSLIDGIESRLPNLEAVLQYIRDLMPSSPARTGPLSEPVDWSFLAEGLPKALDSVNAALATPRFAVGMPDLQGAMASAGVQKSFNWTINNPTREPEDIARDIRRAELVDRYRD